MYLEGESCSCSTSHQPLRQKWTKMIHLCLWLQYQSCDVEEQSRLLFLLLWAFTLQIYSAMILSSWKRNLKIILYEHETVSVLTAAAHYPEYPQCVSATGGCRLLSPFILLRCRQSPLGEPANPSPAHTRPTETKTRAELSIVSLRVGCWESCLYFLRVLSKE